MTATSAKQAKERRVTGRAARARHDILQVATSEFAANGYAGARVDVIAGHTRTTKRMIYYYFGSKENLYLAVLENAYAQIRAMERGIHIDELEPEVALRVLAEGTYDHHTTHEEFMQLVSIENIHRAQFVKRSEAILTQNASAIDLLTEVLRRGVLTGKFRDDLDAVDVHMMISAFACFHVANRHTFAAIFRRDMLDPSLQDSHRRLIGDMIVETLTGVRDARSVTSGSPGSHRRGGCRLHGPTARRTHPAEIRRAAGCRRRSGGGSRIVRLPDHGSVTEMLLGAGSGRRRHREPQRAPRRHGHRVPRAGARRCCSRSPWRPATPTPFAWSRQWMS